MRRLQLRGLAASDYLVSDRRVDRPGTDRGDADPRQRNLRGRRAARPAKRAEQLHHGEIRPDGCRRETREPRSLSELLKTQDWDLAERVGFELETESSQVTGQ